MVIIKKLSRGRHSTPSVESTIDRPSLMQRTRATVIVTSRTKIMARKSFTGSPKYDFSRFGNAGSGGGAEKKAKPPKLPPMSLPKIPKMLGRGAKEQREVSDTINKAGAPNFWSYASPPSYSSPGNYATPTSYMAPFQYGPQSGYGTQSTSLGGGGGGGNSGGSDGWWGGSWGDDDGFVKLSTLIFAIILGVAGIIGFAFAGSLKSLLFGGGAGVLYYGLYLSFGAMNSMTVAMVALGLSIVLSVAFISKALKSQKLIPSGALSMGSVVMSAIYLTNVIQTAS